jgi:hypothetical protein
MFTLPLIPTNQSLKKWMLIGLVAILLLSVSLLLVPPQAHAQTWCYWTGWHTFDCCNSLWPGEQDYQVNHKLCTNNGGRTWYIEQTKRRCHAVSICDF